MKCRICGCTDDDCRQCIEKTGHPCRWAEPNLCSRCKDEMEEEDYNMKLQDARTDFHAN